MWITVYPALPPQCVHAMDTCMDMALKIGVGIAIMEAGGNIKHAGKIGSDVLELDHI